MFLADDSSKQSWNSHDHSRTIRYKSMTSANGGTYAGRYALYGDRAETQSIPLQVCLFR